MPLKKAKGKSKAAMQKAVSANIRELKKSETKRPQAQIVAIAAWASANEIDLEPLLRQRALALTAHIQSVESR